MSKIRYKIRIYTAHDLDLVTLIRNYHFNAVKALYCALNGFYKKELFAIQIPERREIPLKARKSFSKTLSLDSEKDAELIEMLENIQTGYRNFFLKNVLRMYIDQPAFSDFFVDGYQKYESCLYRFREGKRIVNAATIKQRKTVVTVKNQDTQGSSIEKVEPSTQFEKHETIEQTKKQDLEEDELTDLFSSFLDF